MVYLALVKYLFALFAYLWPFIHRLAIPLNSCFCTCGWPLCSHEPAVPREANGPANQGSSQPPLATALDVHVSLDSVDARTLNGSKTRIAQSPEDRQRGHYAVQGVAAAILQD